MKSSRTKCMLQEGQHTESNQDDLVVEKALQIIVNGKEFSMTMQTPGDERYLIRGLLHAEGIQHSQFEDFHQCESDNGTIVRVSISCKKKIHDTRNLHSTSSCGLCGKKSIKNIYDGFDKLTDNFSIDAETIQKVYQKVAQKQSLFKKTGGCHAASAVDANGEIICVFEDIGRHNATDKVIGWLLEKNRLNDAKILTVSGRVSFEIIQKCMRAKIQVLTAISAPSTLAVEMAERANITLAAFCRGDRATFYSGLHRVTTNRKLYPIG